MRCKGRRRDWLSPLECVGLDCNGTQVFPPPPPPSAFLLAFSVWLSSFCFFPWFLSPTKRGWVRRVLSGRERRKVTYKVFAWCDFPTLESRARWGWSRLMKSGWRMNLQSQLMLCCESSGSIFQKLSLDKAASLLLFSFSVHPLFLLYINTSGFCGQKK